MLSNKVTGEKKWKKSQNNGTNLISNNAIVELASVVNPDIHIEGQLLVWMGNVDYCLVLRFIQRSLQRNSVNFFHIYNNICAFYTFKQMKSNLNALWK